MSESARLTLRDQVRRDEVAQLGERVRHTLWEALQMVAWFENTAVEDAYKKGVADGAAGACRHSH